MAPGQPTAHVNSVRQGCWGGETRRCSEKEGATQQATGGQGGRALASDTQAHRPLSQGSGKSKEHAASVTETSGMSC